MREDNAALLGAWFVNGIQQAAMSRADIAEPDRRDFFAYVDEFQNFVTDSFATILSEARKYRLSLTLATQYLKQMERDGNTVTRDAVFGNVGSIISFQVGPDDGEDLARQLSKYEDQVTSTDLTSLPKYRAYVRLLIDGMPSRPFTMKTLPPPRCDNDRSTKIRNVSRRRYGVQAARG